METAKDISRSIFATMEEIKAKYSGSKYIQDLIKLDVDTKKRSKLEGRELADWNAKISKKCRRRFDTIVRTVCNRNGRNEDHIRLIAGWKRGRNITNLNFKDND